MSYRKHIDDFFREKLGNYKEAPPPGAWEELEVRLDGLTPAVPGSPLKLFRHIAIISGLVVLSLSAGKKLLDRRTTVADAPVAGTTATPVQTASPEGTRTAPAATAPSTPDAVATASNAQPGNNFNTSGNSVAPVVASAATRRTSRHQRTIAARLQSHPSPFRQHADGEWMGTNPTNDQPSVAANTEDQNSSTASPGSALSGGPNQAEQTPGAPKKDDEKKAKKDEPKNDGTRSVSAKNNGNPVRKHRIEAGLKGGYEAGFASGTQSKVVIGPYVQYKLSEKLSILTQPAAKFVPSHTSSETYYSVHDNGTMDAQYTPVTNVHSGKIDTIGWAGTFTYSQKHDSIANSHNYKAVTEFEIPLLLKYNLCSKFGVYAGLNVVFAQTPDVTEHGTETRDIIRQATRYDTTKDGTLPATPNVRFAYTGTRVLPEFMEPTRSTPNMRVGYMVGMSYNCGDRWMLDALMQQTPAYAPANFSTASSPYFRFTLGYKLKK